MQITSKFNGMCTRCKKPISKGTRINWARGEGAKHLQCDSNTIVKDGKTLEQLACEWDKEHQNDLTVCERLDQMMQDKDYRNVPEDALYQYACQDTQRNPYR